jgi:predicted nucleic-acid-binding protein
MKAVDTNVLVRFVTDDDAKQAAAARSLLASSPIWIAKTVILETAWVLRSHYGFNDDSVRDSLTKLLGLENVHAEDAQQVAAALALTEEAIDFADALHLCSRPTGAAFVSFDRAFIRRAKRAGASAVVSLG